jgi:GntR family transcriptional regulator, transcriptional repressor for pyruvate dehydrogenase complex
MGHMPRVPDQGHHARRREDAVGELQRLIEQGELPPGARLPSERKLAERLGMSRGTVREALQFLGAMGLVETRRGGGTNVRAAPGNAHELRPAWLEWVGRNRRRILDTLEAREGCEAFAAELAARRVAPDHLEQMVEALRRMGSAAAGKDITGLVQADLLFHDGLVRAAGNAALRDVACMLGQRLVRERAATWDLPGRAERSLAEHRAIYKAVCDGDAPRAAAAVRAHLRSVRDDVVASLLVDLDGPVTRRRRPHQRREHRS